VVKELRSIKLQHFFLLLLHGTYSYVCWWSLSKLQLMHVSLGQDPQAALPCGLIITD